MRVAVTLALVLGVVVALSARQAADPTRVACQVPNDADQRMYLISRTQTGQNTSWYLSYKSKTVRDWIRLRLPGAVPTISATSAVLSYKSANGGIAVDLNAGPERASLDVYVSYELEVNVDASLSPDVDVLNTHGTLTNLSCRIGSPSNVP